MGYYREVNYLYKPFTVRTDHKALVHHLQIKAKRMIDKKWNQRYSRMHKEERKNMETSLADINVELIERLVAVSFIMSEIPFNWGRWITLMRHEKSLWYGSKLQVLIGTI